MQKFKGPSHEVEYSEEDFERLLSAFYDNPYTLNQNAFRLIDLT
jgi:hypothetical protein